MKFLQTTFNRLLIIGLLVISSPFMAYAAPHQDDGLGPPFPGMIPPPPFMVMDENAPFLLPPELSLSESQRDKVFSIMHTQAPLLYEQHKTIRKAYIELHNLAISGNYSDESARPITEELGKAHANVNLVLAHGEHQIHALLSSEQQRLLLSSMQSRQPKNRDGFEPPNTSKNRNGFRFP